MTKCPIEVFWKDEDEGYIPVVPDLPGCNAWGKTEAAAIREAHDAITAWIKAAKSMQRAIPAPSKPQQRELRIDTSHLSPRAPLSFGEAALSKEEVP